MLERSNDLLTCEVGRTDLMWCVRYNLLAVEDASFDRLPNLTMADTELCGGIAQRQPLAILLGGAVAVDAAYTADELTRCAVQVLPWPVGIPIRFSDAAMS